MLRPERTLSFVKMQGSGNDFVVIDNRQGLVAEESMAEFAMAACERRFGVGADGIFFLENASAGEGVNYRWHFYNADGSRAEMCGNASRCAARLAYELGMAPAEHIIGTDAGPVEAQVLPDLGQVKVRLPAPQGLRLNLRLDVAGQEREVHFVNTGVPHAVVLVSELDNVDVDTLGRALRLHEAFAPAGSNVNFARVVDRQTMRLRTYERGVEGETYACGTGACASVFIAWKLGLTDSRVRVTTTGGETLVVEVGERLLYLQGGAEIVFTGEMNLDALPRLEALAKVRGSL